MGDAGLEPLETRPVERSTLPSANTGEDISVLVTGFGPFKTYLANASHLIASSLPSSFAVSSAVPSASPSHVSTPRRVTVHTHATPIPVSYSTIRDMIPAILEEHAKAHGRRPDIVLHMGIAATRNYYSVETQAHRDSYHLCDINGKPGFQDGEMHWRALGLPPVLKAGQSTDGPTVTPSQKVARRQYANPHPPDSHFVDTWKALGPPGADCRISIDAGRYACEFILYTSLALALQQGRDRSVAFLHVPGSCSEKDIEFGRQVTLAFIKALVTCWFDEALEQ